MWTKSNSPQTGHHIQSTVSSDRIIVKLCHRWSCCSLATSIVPEVPVFNLRLLLCISWNVKCVCVCGFKRKSTSRCVYKERLYTHSHLHSRAKKLHSVHSLILSFYLTFITFLLFFCNLLFCFCRPASVLTANKVEKWTAWEESCVFCFFKAKVLHFGKQALLLSGGETDEKIEKTSSCLVN